MKRSLKLVLTYVLPLVMVGLLIGTVVFSTVIRKKKTVEYDYAKDVSETSMNEKVIRVASDVDYAPYSYYDDDGVPCGHNIELIYAIAKREGYRIDLSLLPWKECKSGLKEGKYDVVLSSVYTQGTEYGNLTALLYSDSYSFFGRTGTALPQDIQQLKNKKIALLDGGSATEIYLKPLDLEETVTYYDTLTEAFRAVNNGEMDYVIASDISGRNIISTNDFDMEKLGNNIFDNFMCFMVSKDNEELLISINESIAVFQNNGYLEELNNKWCEDYRPDMTFGSLVEQNKTLFTLIAAILILAFYTIIFSLAQLAKQKEKTVSETSNVTGLPNLNAFRRNVEEIIAANPDEKYVIIRIDIDHFKLFNDTYGTAEGDALLYKIGQEAVATIKDLNMDVLLGHATGDHFILMMKEADFSPIRLYNRCTNMLSALDPNYNFAVRIGYVKVDNRNVDAAIYCDWAYLALKSIKGDYAKHWAEYDSSMRHQILEEREIANEMVNALEKGQFVPYFQPQINYQTKKISGAEVLVRWIHPEKGMISPGKFIPVFEKNGFIYEMDKYIWRQACIFLKKAEENGLIIPNLSVNISRRDVYREDLLATLNSLVREYGIEKSKLHLEITESAYSDNPKLLKEVVERLGNDGYIIEMDDFGSGYSSLSILKDLPFDVVKLDMFFLNNSETVGKTGNIISSIVHMTHQINMAVIAEGVETAEQANFLRSVGCYHMQGYLFSKPIDEKSFIEYLKNNEAESSVKKIKDIHDNDAVDFLDDRTQNALLFNNFIGSACLMEIQGTHINILRVNDRFFEELGVEGQGDFDMLTDIASRLDEESLVKFNEMAEKAALTGDEVTGRLHMKPIVEGNDGIWLFVRARFLAKKVDSLIFFCLVENISESMKLADNNELLLNELNSIIKNLPGGLARVKYDGKVNFEYMSYGFARIHGYYEQEYTEKLNENMFFNVHTDDIERVKTAIESSFGDNPKFNVTYRTLKNGQYIWVQLNGLTQKLDAGIYMTYLYCTDVTADVEKEKKLKESESTISSIMSSVSGGSALFEFDGTDFRMLEISDGIVKAMDRASADFKREVESDINTLIYDQDVEKVMKSIERGLKTGENSSITFRVKKGNEEPLWLRMHCIYENTENNTVLIRCIFRDISTSSGLYENVINETNTGIIVIDKNSHETLFANKAGAAVYEMLPETLVGKQCYEYCWGNGIHCSLWTDNLPPEGLTIEDDYNGRHYVVRRKTISWNGIDAIITYYFDRTATYSSERQFMDLVSNIPCGIFIYENTGKEIVRTYINEVGQKILETNEDSGNDHRKLIEDTHFIYKDDVKKYLDALTDASENNRAFSLEIRTVAADESVKWTEFDGQPFYSAEKQKQLIYVVFADITARKQAENEVLLRGAEYYAAANQSNKMICRYIIDKKALSVSKEVADRFDSFTYLENAPEELVRQGYIAKESIDAWQEMFEAIDRGQMSGRVNEISIAMLSKKEFRWYRASFQTLKDDTGNNAVAIMSFEDITDRLEEIRREERKKKLDAIAESNQNSKTNDLIISALHNLNYATWVIDIDENLLLPINDTEYSQFFGEKNEVYGNARKSIEVLLDKFVDDEDKERISKFMDVSRLKQYLKIHDSDKIEYYGKRNGWTRIQIFPTEDNENGEISRIIVSFTRIADEKRKEAEADEKLKKALDELRQSDLDKRRDYLTKLYNRYELGKDASEKESDIAAVYMMDIDNFKDYNDNYGHVAGDKCLSQIGQKFMEYSEKHNIKFYRYGGEEIIALSFDKNDDADKTAKELVDLVRNLNINTSVSDYGVVTISLGYTTENAEFIQKVSMADEALYKAKEAGKNQSCRYEK